MGNIRRNSDGSRAIHLFSGLTMDLDARLEKIEKTQSRILGLLVKNQSAPSTMTLKEAAEYVGFSADHFRRLSVEQHKIPFARPSGQQKGKIVFRKSDLDRFLDISIEGKTPAKSSGRRRMSKVIRTW